MFVTFIAFAFGFACGIAVAVMACIVVNLEREEL